MTGDTSVPNFDDTWIKLRGFALLVGIGLFLAFIRPYDATRNLSYVWSVLYWVMTVVAGGYSAAIGMTLYNRLRPTRANWELLVVAALVSTLVVTAFIIVIEASVSDGVPLYYWPMLYLQVLVIATAITLIGYTVSRAFGGGETVHVEAGDAERQFLERLPMKFREAELWAISSEDHYLRVHTNLGEELILMRLADAVRELAGSEGLQTHRSWWVSKAGIAETRRENGRLMLVLKSGVEAPVSRSFQPAVRDAGIS